MNPLTKVKLINELNDREAQLGVADKLSWHSEYKDSAWIFLGGLPYELTEGDIICVFSHVLLFYKINRYGEIVNINLVRDKKTGKSKGFCFLCYEDQRSTVLAVDNFNGIKIKGRTIRVDHVSNYRAPKDPDVDDVTRELQEKGCGAPTLPLSLSESSEDDKSTKKHKKDKKEKKKRKTDKEKTDQEVQVEQPASSSSPRSKTIKEKDDAGPKKHSSKNSERAQKSESRERWKHQPGSPEVRTACRGGEEDLDRESKKEKPKHEHKSSSRKEAREEKNRDQDRGRSLDTHSSWHNGRSEGRSHRSRSQDKSHRHKRARRSGERESLNPIDRRHH
ncbi:RNA-binding motif protein, X-linked 2 isoform X1 [Cynocephalus volans]|uniref:RNA-binding motif protein, X-linked 2 isoform X1 n=1 Tax=Cynocephalus volans TaxID=110931 RepID=UPI002FC6ECDC